jgi:Cu/Ag efflux protein CusF
MSLVAVALFCTPAFAADARDPIFSRLHFDDWQVDKAKAPFKWTMEMHPVVLSNHQRWLSQVDVRIDGEELLTRRGTGALLVLFQFQDAAGTVYQDHGVLDLTKVETGAKAQIVIYSEYAFAMPGTYPLAIGVYDTNTKEHWFRRETLKVPVHRGDPLPFAWRDLPPIEFRPHDETPDSWFLPEVTGKLHLPVETRHPLKIDVLVNLTPSERASSSQQIQDRNLSVLLPTMKVLGAMEIKGSSLGIESVDLERQKVTFRQDAVRQIDWPKMRAALTTDQVGTIDVKSLGDRDHSVQFFIGEVGKRVRTSDVLIILSSSVRFEPGMDLEPIHAEGTPDCRVYYIRYHPPPAQYMVPQQAVVRGRVVAVPGRGRLALGPTAIDQLEPTLKPLKHRLYDVQTPEEMRKALADLIAELSVL